MLALVTLKPVLVASFVPKALKSFQLSTLLVMPKLAALTASKVCKVAPLMAFTAAAASLVPPTRISKRTDSFASCGVPTRLSKGAPPSATEALVEPVLCASDATPVTASATGVKLMVISAARVATAYVLPCLLKPSIVSLTGSLKKGLKSKARRLRLAYSTS